MDLRSPTRKFVNPIPRSKSEENNFFLHIVEISVQAVHLNPSNCIVLLFAKLHFSWKMHQPRTNHQQRQLCSKTLLPTSFPKSIPQHIFVFFALFVSFVFLFLCSCALYFWRRQPPSNQYHSRISEHCTVRGRLNSITRDRPSHSIPFNTVAC